MSQIGSVPPNRGENFQIFGKPPPKRDVSSAPFGLKSSSKNRFHSQTVHFQPIQICPNPHLAAVKLLYTSEVPTGCEALGDSWEPPDAPHLQTPKFNGRNLKMMVSKRNHLFQGLLFRFHVKFQGCSRKIRIIPGSPKITGFS